MRKGMIRLSSVTYAVRAQRMLQNVGIDSRIIKVAKSLNISGCGYGLELYGDIEAAAKIVADSGIRVLEIIY